MYIVHVQVVPRLVEVQGEVDEVHAEGGDLDADECPFAIFVRSLKVFVIMVIL